MKRLMLTLSLFAAFGLILGLAACKKETPAVPADETKKEDKKDPEAKKEEPKEAKKEEAKKEEGGGGEKIGVAECDEYLDKYEKCISSKVPEAARGAMKTGMTTMRDAWKKAAATAEGKAALAVGCKAAMAGAKQATAAFNCEW